jgi:large subunit ribosomal protein L4
MQVELFTSEGLKQLELSDAVFAQRFNEALVHQVVTSCLANARQGSHAQKNRAAVSGGGKKPWKQKGSGRARAGTIRSPLWRKGGVTFAATPSDYSKKMNKKMYRLGMCSIFSELFRQKRISILDDLRLEKSKTKELLKVLKQFNLPDNVLIILEDVTLPISLAARNLPKVDVCTVRSIDPVKLVKFEHILTTDAALKRLEGALR